MQCIKVGPIKIPYRIKWENHKKIFQVCGIQIPFSTYMKDGHKYYKLWFLSFRLPHADKYLITQSYSNYLMRDELNEEKIKSIATQIFKEKVGYTPDFDHPRSMNEKIFWMKLHYHNPMITRCCDKFRVKDYVMEKLGPGMVIPTIQSWECAEDIDFTQLPEKYVLKVNWSSGYNLIVRDKGMVDVEEMRRKIADWMQPHRNSYYQAFNWGYKNMKPVVYAEQYMEQIDGQLYDYKFFCCNGKVKFWFIATDRFKNGNLTHDFYDMNFQKMKFDYGRILHSDLPLEKPRFYDEMIRCAEILSAPFPFVRVDFYEINDKFYVGEMTFYPAGGLLPMRPVEWDYKLGSYIDLPKID